MPPIALPLLPPAPKFITSFNRSWAVVVGTIEAAGAGGGLEDLGVTILGLRIGFTGVMGLARAGETVGEILPLCVM
jgi:hypothetical protein